MPITNDNGIIGITGAKSIRIAQLISLKHAVHLWAIDTKLWPLKGKKSMTKTVEGWGFEVPKSRNRSLVYRKITEQIDAEVERLAQEVRNGDEKLVDRGTD